MPDTLDPRREGHDAGPAIVPSWAREGATVFVGAIATAKIFDALGLTEKFEEMFPDVLPLGSIIVLAAAAGWVFFRCAKYVTDHPYVRSGISIATLVFVVAVVLFVMFGSQGFISFTPVLAGPTNASEWPAHDWPGDRARLIDPGSYAGETAAPREVRTFTFKLRNDGLKTWKDRWFCRWDELNDRDNLRTDGCVRIPNTRPGGVAEIYVEVTIPDREGSFTAEFKMADIEAKAWYFNSVDYDPVVLEVVVSK